MLVYVVGISTIDIKFFLWFLFLSPYVLRLPITQIIRESVSDIYFGCNLYLASWRLMVWWQEVGKGVFYKSVICLSLDMKHCVVCVFHKCMCPSSITGFCPPRHLFYLLRAAFTTIFWNLVFYWFFPHFGNTRRLNMGKNSFIQVRVRLQNFLLGNLFFLRL